MTDFGDNVMVTRYGSSSVEPVSIVWAGRAEIDGSLAPIALATDRNGRDIVISRDFDRPLDDGAVYDVMGHRVRDVEAGDEDDLDEHIHARIDAAL